ncbi:hypothetical protein HAX54_052533, partial [Datura stramonium]|nr:hypothetical protein [Datura stramonium]
EVSSPNISNHKFLQGTFHLSSSSTLRALFSKFLDPQAVGRNSSFRVGVLAHPDLTTICHHRIKSSSLFESISPFSQGIWDPRWLRVSPSPQWDHVGVLVSSEYPPELMSDITPVMLLTL